MPVPTSNEISVKGCIKISKYKDLEMKIEKMWHLETITLLVIVGQERDR